MSHANLLGQHFAIGSKSIELMKLMGSPDGKSWIIGILISSGDYIPFEVPPAPALKNVLEVIQQDIDDGNISEVRMVAISNRVAVRLWLEGVLTRKEFEGALEGEANEVPYVILSSVKLGNYTLPVAILPETTVGTGHICTLDEQLFIVGGGTDVYPYLPIPSKTLPLLP